MGTSLGRVDCAASCNDGRTVLLPEVMGTLLSHQGQPELRGNFQPTERKLVDGTLFYLLTTPELLGGAPRERQSGRRKPGGFWDETDRLQIWLSAYWLLFYLLIAFESQHLWGGIKYSCLFMQQLVTDGEHAPDVGLGVYSGEETPYNRFIL